MNPLDIPQVNVWLAGQGAAGRMAVQRIVVEEDLFAGLAELLRSQRAGKRSVLVFMDQTPMRRAGRDAKAEFLSIVQTVCQPQVAHLGTVDAPPHADLEVAEHLKNQLPPGALLISFGSGTVTDLVKHSRFLADKRWSRRQ